MDQLSFGLVITPAMEAAAIRVALLKCRTATYVFDQQEDAQLAVYYIGDALQTLYMLAPDHPTTECIVSLLDVKRDMRDILSIESYTYSSSSLEMMRDHVWSSLLSVIDYLDSLTGGPGLLETPGN